NADHARATQQHDHMQVAPDAEVLPPLPQIVERQMALAARHLAQPLPVIAQTQPLARAGQYTGFDAIPAGDAACRPRRSMIKLWCGFRYPIQTHQPVRGPSWPRGLLARGE